MTTPAIRSSSGLILPRSGSDDCSVLRRAPGRNRRPGLSDERYCAAAKGSTHRSCSRPRKKNAQTGRKEQRKGRKEEGTGGREARSRRRKRNRRRRWNKKINRLAAACPGPSRWRSTLVVLVS